MAVSSGWAVAAGRAASSTSGGLSRATARHGRPSSGPGGGPSSLPRRVVVTGLGTVSPMGLDTQTAWTGLLSGKSAVRNILEGSELAAEEAALFRQIPSRVAARVPRGASLEDRSTRELTRPMAMGILAAEEAWLDCGLEGKADPERVGVAVGNAIADLDFVAASKEAMARGVHKVSPYFVPKVLANMAAGHISIRHGFMGPIHSVSTACATGTHAIGDAFNFVRNDAADVVLAGGTEACVSPLVVAAFTRARALSTKFNDRPEEASRPFDAARDGFVIGEGAGVLVLEELGHAVQRGAKIYCEVLGYGLSGDAHHITSGREDGRGAYLAMSAAHRAFRQLHRGHHRELGGGLGYGLWCVNAHATSTPKGDQAELKAIQTFVSELSRGSSEPGDEDGPPPMKLLDPDAGVLVTSHKSNFGHLLGAAGAVESAFVAMALREGTIPRTLNVVDPDEGMQVPGLTKILRESMSTSNACNASSGPRRAKVIFKNSFGFGGTNACLIFGEHIQSP